MKRKMRVKIVAAVLAVCILSAFSFVSITAADTGKKYVALGDSITAGYGLTNPESESFPSVIARKYGLTLANEGISGQTLKTLSGTIGSKAEILRDADVVTITIGGNDMMEVLYKRGYDTYAQYCEEPCTIDEYKELIASSDYIALFSLVAYGIPGAAASDEYTEFLNKVPAYLGTVFDVIRSVSPDAVIIIETQYHPYLWLQGNFVSYCISEIESALIRYRRRELNPQGFNRRILPRSSSKPSSISAY